MIVSESQIRDCKLGEDVSIVNPVNMYECIVGPFSQIGPFVEIQKDAVIGAHCKIQSHTFICSKVFIGHYCFIGHGVIFTNDTFANGSPNPDPNSWKATFIDSHVTIGSGVTLLPVNICSNVTIGAGAVVTKDITKSGIYIGNPAKLYKSLP